MTGTGRHREVHLRAAGKDPGLPIQVFGEYAVAALVVDTGKLYQQTDAGVLIAEDGKIKRLREALDTAAAARASGKD